MDNNRQLVPNWEDYKTLAGSLVSICCKKYNLWREKEDMLQDAYVALWKASQRFDASRGVKPSTYFYSVIWGTLKNYMRDKLLKGPGNVVTIDSLEQVQHEPIQNSDDRLESIREDLLDCHPRLGQIARYAEEGYNFQEIALFLHTSLEELHSFLDSQRQLYGS